MDVTLLIVRADDGYRVRVIVPGPPMRSWLKVYESKSLCLAELRYLGFLMPEDALEATANDFDTQARCWSITPIPNLGY